MFNGGSESRLLMPVGRAPDVARGPSASKKRLLPSLSPSPLASDIIFPFTLSCRTGEAGRQNQGGAGGELFLTLLPPEEHAAPFAQDTLYGLHRMHDGGCV